MSALHKNNALENALITTSNMPETNYKEFINEVTDTIPSGPSAYSTSGYTFGTTTYTDNINGRYRGGSDGGSGSGIDSEHPKYLETHAYSRRWWILLMLCISMMQNSNNWISFSVCYDETHALYGWNKNQVDLLTAWGPFLFIPIAIILPYLNKIFTFRALMTISNLLMCIGCVIRSFPPDTIPNGNIILILAHIGQILNAIAAPLIYAMPQQLSAIWFTPQQRTTSTSIAVVSGYAGGLISYLTIYYVDKSSHRLLTVLRLEAVFSLVFFIIVLSDQIWYNDIPPIPPSVSSMLSLEKHTFSEQSVNYKQELILILNNRKFHYFAIICGAYQGILSAWIGILDVIFGTKYIGFKQTYVALIGISSILAIIFSGIIFGAINDKLHKRIKLIIVTLLFVSGVFLVLFTILVNGHNANILGQETNNTIQCFAIIFCVIGIFCNAGTYGLSYEAAVELIYPSREVFAGTILTIYFNLFSSLFILLNNYLSPLYMNWIISIIQIISCILLLFYNQEYKRLEYDQITGRAKTFGRTPTNQYNNYMPQPQHSVNDPKTVHASKYNYITPNSSNFNISKSEMETEKKKDNNDNNDINESLHSSI
eukprot:507282_1